MNIRYITDKDDPCEISGIYEQSWKFAYKGIIPQSFLDSIPHGKWVSHLGKDSMHHLVIDEDGWLTGTASFCASRWEQFAGYGELVSIYLLPEYMGKGRGAALMAEALKGLSDAGFDRVMLWVLEDNHRARRFYEKQGFICAEVFLENEIGGKLLREVAYVHGKSE